MASDNVLEFTNGNWQTEVVDSKIPVVVDFWAPWCGPCRALTPAINSVAAKYAGRVKVGKVNIDEDQDLAVKYAVSTIPRIFFFKGGDRPRQVITTLVPEAEIVKAIESLLQEA